MQYFYVDPEVAGGLGKNTVMDRSVHPPIVSKLHYDFDGWLGDVLLETFPCFIVTEPTKQELEASGLSGLNFDQVEVTQSEEFQDFYPNRQLPKFVWLRVAGKPGRDDFGTSENGRLVVSEAALKMLQRLGISNALIAKYGN